VRTCVTNTVSLTWCCLSDGRRPPELSLQGAGSNRQMLLCPKGMVVSDLLKAADYGSRCVLERRAKANHAMTRRNAKTLSKAG